MRELHVVAVSEDGRHVVLATDAGATGGSFRVAIDDRLVQAVRGDLPRPGEPQGTPVSPKDIQARLRAGESVEDIAASAGVPVSRIERYAGPVLSERERILGLTRAGHVTRSRLGTSAVPLGEAVDRHLADNAGVRPETVLWSVRREEVGTWLVELSYVSQARRRQVGWRYDVARREVTPVDSASAALAHLETGRAARSTGPAAEPPAPVGRQRSAPAPRPRAGSGRSAAPAQASRPAPAARATGSVAARAVATRSVAARPADGEAARAAKAEAARKEQVARAAKAEAARAAKAEAARAEQAAAVRKEQAAVRKEQAAAVRKENAAAVRKDKAAAARRAKTAAARAAQAAPPPAPPVPAGPPTLRVVGGEDRGARRRPKPAPAAARTAPPRVAGQRASVPGWADVLLSTAPVRRAAVPDPDEG